MLVIYCLKDVSIFTGNHGGPEFAAIAAVVGLHCWKRQMLLSIAGERLFICCWRSLCFAEGYV